MTLVHQGQALHYHQVFTPKLALTSPFLLDSLLAFSGLHLAYLDPVARESWMRIAMTYHDRALVGFNEVLANISGSNCEAATLCSILVLLITVAAMGLPRQYDNLDPVFEILGLRKLLRGCQLILEEWKDTLLSGDLHQFFGPMFCAHENQQSDMEQWKREG